MKGSDVFPSKWLSAADLQGREPTVTIDKVAMEEVEKGKEKPVLYFRGKAKGMVLNKTNWNRLEMITKDDESDNWSGREITLYVDIVDFQGKPTEAIRIKPPPRRPAQNGGKPELDHVVEERKGYTLSTMRPRDPIEEATGTLTRDPARDDSEIPF